jgi:hypothetical protein
VTLEVKVSKVQYVAASVLAVIMLPLSLFSLIRGVTRQSLIPLLLGSVFMMLVAAVFYLVGRGRRNSVKRFTDRGLTRGDLSELPWADLEKVIDVMHTEHGKRYIWRTEIQFKNGRSAWVIPSKVSNYPEVRAFVDALACEHVSK